MGHKPLLYHSDIRCFTLRVHVTNSELMPTLVCPVLSTLSLYLHCYLPGHLGPAFSPFASIAAFISKEILVVNLLLFLARQSGCVRLQVVFLNLVRPRERGSPNLWPDQKFDTLFMAFSQMLHFRKQTLWRPFADALVVMYDGKEASSKNNMLFQPGLECQNHTLFDQHD